MNKIEINQWAKQITEVHKNPLKKLELPGTKFFIPSGTETEADLVQNSLETVANALRSDRVDRRCARSVANWLPEQKLAEVIKNCGVVNSYGFANKSGKFVYPEEAMVLLETNRLELLWNNVPISIQQAYEMLINDSTCSLAQYVTYRKLILQGFRLIRTDHVQKHDVLEEPKPKKQRFCEKSDASTSQIDDEGLKSIKHVKCERVPSECDLLIEETFRKLQESGPKQFVPQMEDDCDYKIFLPESNSRTSQDFNLKICQNKYISPCMAMAGQKIPTVQGYTNSQFVGYLRTASVNLPHLM